MLFVGESKIGLVAKKLHLDPLAQALAGWPQLVGGL